VHVKSQQRPAEGLRKFDEIAAVQWVAVEPLFCERQGLFKILGYISELLLSP
jgi:hypothetical protein